MHFRKTTTPILALAASSASAQECDYAKSNTCINPQVSASVALPIPTLFPPSSPPTFTYAIANLSHSDIIAITASNPDVSVPASSANGPMQAVSWWLSFNNGTANTTGSQERAYTAFALESNSTNDITGADGGCEGLLGKNCVEDLKRLFSATNTLYIGGTPGTGALMKFFASPPGDLRCDDVLWGDGSGTDMLGGTSNTRPLVANSQWIARITDTYFIDQDLMSGNASHTQGRTTMRFRTFEEQKKLAIVAFSLGYPSGGPGNSDETTLNMACLRVGKVDKNSGDTGDNDSAAGKLALGMATVTAAILTSIFTL